MKTIKCVIGEYKDYFTFSSWALTCACDVFNARQLDAQIEYARNKGPMLGTTLYVEDFLG